MTSKLEPKERKAQILTEALLQAARFGYQNIERQKIADKIDVSPALVNRYFRTMPELKRSVMGEALRILKGPERSQVADVPALAVLAQGVALKDRRAMNAPEALRQAALDSLKTA